jgi:hypothetical protein
VCPARGVRTALLLTRTDSPIVLTPEGDVGQRREDDGQQDTAGRAESNLTRRRSRRGQSQCLWAARKAATLVRLPHTA